MITQKAISVKMDAVTLEELDRECYFYGKKRNRVINDAVEHYMKHCACCSPRHRCPQ